MTLPPCPNCSIVLEEKDVIPDGPYSFGSTMLVSFKCVLPCKTNRAVRFEDVSPGLRRAAMMADLARDEQSEMEI